MLRCALVCLRELLQAGAKRCRFERWSDVALLEVRRRRIVLSKMALDRGISRFVALSSSSLGLSISTSLETGVAGLEEREVAVVLECLRDCGPVVLLFFDSFGVLQVTKLDRVELQLVDPLFDLSRSCIDIYIEPGDVMCLESLCHNCAQPGHFSRVRPVGGQSLSQSRQGSVRGYSQRPQPFAQTQRSGFRPREPSRFGGPSRPQFPGSQQAQVNALTSEQAAEMSAIQSMKVRAAIAHVFESDKDYNDLVFVIHSTILFSPQLSYVRLTNLARMETSLKDDRNKSDHDGGGTAARGGAAAVVR
ncbi:pentatricopeptide repeat-containing protein mitochondrial-like [Dorcoceras hygrometricum]|uniref:Pentatricopeptide repeat-containing protein mitochondrial-like n=1 Tax=Dorcoceras hygrometricum TaxID=472368 RepID=A0A2Z7BCA6_9LAMI|nr:pentatricopeptide repeat-containing protein mitochondrial-like [Dorcoceras hygrometricum]